MKARDKTMILLLVMSAAVVLLGAACICLGQKVKEQSGALSRTETLYNDVRREKNRLIIEKAEIEKNCFTLEQINAGLLADNARLTAERDAAKAQQKQPENVEIAAEPERGVPDVCGEWCGSVCSACGESTSFWYNCNYCPHCGAKMSESEDNDNA